MTAPSDREPSFSSLINALRLVEGYAGLLAYGSLARNSRHSESDIDLVAVVSPPSPAIERVHTAHADLNFLTIDDLKAIKARAARMEGLPWDAMFENLLVLDDASGCLTDIALDLSSAIQSGFAPVNSIDDLRFLLYRRLKSLRTTSCSDGLLGHSRTSSVVSLLVAINGVVRGVQWQGLDAATCRFIMDNPDQARRLEHLLESGALDCLERSLALEAIAGQMLSSHGGLWDGGDPLYLGSSLRRAAGSARRELPPNVLSRVERILLSL